MAGPQHRPIAANRDQHIEVAVFYTLPKALIIDRALRCVVSLLFKIFADQVYFGEGIRHFLIGDNYWAFRHEGVGHIEILYVKRERIESRG